MKLNEESIIKLGKILKESREKNNFTLEQVKIRLDHLGIKVNKSDIQRVENAERKVPNAILIKNLCKIYNLDVIALFKEIGYLDDEVLEHTKGSNINYIENSDMIKVPVFDSVSAGAGLEPDPDPVDFLSLPKSMADGSVIINVHGDSMEPTIKDGSSILVKLDVEVSNNDIGVFIHDREALVKRYKCFNGKHYLYSDNLNYPPIEVRENDEFKICGKVIWIMNKA